jgi:hypothetical protein
MSSHDESYKLLFSHPQMVADLLQGFVQAPWVSGKQSFGIRDSNGVIANLTSVNIVSSTADLGDTRIRQTYGFIRLSPKSAVLDLMIFTQVRFAINQLLPL